MAATASLRSLVTPSISRPNCRTSKCFSLRSRVRGSKWQSTIQCCSSESPSEDLPSPSDSKPGRVLVVKRRAAMVVSAAAFGFAACACCGHATTAMAAADAEWSYGGPSDPPLRTGTCATGQKQSPVDVKWRQVQRGDALGALLFDYQLSSPVFTNPGHGTMEVAFPGG